MFFQKNVIRKYVATLPLEQTAEAWNRYQQYFLDVNIQANIRQSKEEQFQEGFLRELFVKILGYTLNPSPNYNLITEQKNETNAKKADGAIILRETLTDRDLDSRSKGANPLVKESVIGVIELKDHKTTDLSKVETQAFGYKSQHPQCRYVIISNFEKLRLYIDNATSCREWDLFTMKEDDFKELYLCLAWTQMQQGIAIQLKQESVSAEDQITNALYKDYSQFKRALFADIVKQNPYLDSNGACPIVTSAENEKQWQLLLFKKTQKLLDRLLFIFFAEDCALLPPNSMVQIIDQWEKLKEMDEYRPFYDRVKKYFGYMNTGFQGKKYEIFAYNGGLFKPDEVLDHIIISDDVLVGHTRKLSEYDFESEVDVNILGHIFENSLTEIEEVTRKISQGEQTEPTVSKRKQDGVFYTPQYITKYIVDNTVGRLCEEKKLKMGIIDSKGACPLVSDKRRQMQTKKAQLDLLSQYRDWLLQLTILDPACGSGAFLNAALQFLIKEHKLIDELEAKIIGSSIEFQGVENSILENNLYGVDINEESVEIAQLSLWLRTAKPHRKLNALNKNIKCGNSLVSDPDIAGDKAFDWHKEFPKVFERKDKKAWHIVTATHDSRTSERMKELEVREKRFNGTMPNANPVELTQEEELLVCEVIDKIIEENKLNVITFNICRDHFHMLLVCEEDECDRIVGMIKSKTAIAINKHRDLMTMSQFNNDDTRGQAPLLSENKSRSIWTQKYSCNCITESGHFNEVIQYIDNNRIKHNLPPLPCNENSKGTCPLVNTVTVDEAFEAEYIGGFDVVIGNPPYVRAELLSQKDIDYYRQNYKVFNSDGDLFSYFYERGINLLKDNGIFGYISNTFNKTSAGKSLRNFVQNYTSIEGYVDFTEVQIFEGATTYPVILLLSKKKESNHSFIYTKIPKTMQGAVMINSAPVKEVVQDELDVDNWSFQSGKMSKVIKKISAYKSIKDQYGKCYRGLLTGLNEAFIINEQTRELLNNQDTKSNELIKPIYEGKDLQKWYNQKLKKYLICSHNGYEGTSAIRIEDYPAIMEYLKGFEPQLSKRYDKGDTPYNLRNCAYQPLFYQNKIVWGNLQNNNKFGWDDRGTIISAPACMLPTDSKALLAVLNSKIVWLFLTSVCVVRNGGYIEVKPQYFEQIPVPELTRGQAPLLSELADRMLSLHEQLQEKRNRFLRRLVDNLSNGACPIVKITSALQTFDQLDFKGFMAELKKQKIKLSLLQQDEWEEYFNQYKAACNEINTQIANTDQEINLRVYHLYGLTYEEVLTVDPETCIAEDKYYTTLF